MDLYPISFDFSLAKQRELVENNQLAKKYFRLQQAYRKVFEKYINKILNLKKYDDMISTSQLNFGICPPERKDYYQQSSTLGLKYIYIKNNLHIEKLVESDLILLENNIENENIILEIVKRTYNDVIKFNYLDNKKIDGVFKTQFFKEFNTNKTMFSNNALVIIIKEGSSNRNLNDDEFRINIKEKYDYIVNLINKMNEEFQNKLNCPIEIGHLLR